MTGKEALNIIKWNKGKAFREAYEYPLNAIEQDLEILEILLKCVRVGIIHYDENDYSTSCDEFCFEFDDLSNEEYLKLCKYLSNHLMIGVDLSNEK